MMSGVISYFYPDLKKDEIKRFGLLAAIFFFIIGAYWLLRLIKQTIFLTVAFPECLGWQPQQGCLFQPTAKFWSPFVVLVMVLVYSKLVDLVKKHQLFYIICSFYAALFATCAGFLFVKDMYGAHVIGKYTLALMGWLSYFTIESFGSLVVALFWSFTNSITDSDSAKRGFPLIVVVAQIAAVLGSGALFFAGSTGLWPVLLLASLLVAAVIPLVHYFVKHIPHNQMVGNVAAAATEKKKEGFIEGFVSGLTLLFSRPYLLGVLIISTFYEAIAQIVEYQMNRYALMLPIYKNSETAFAQFQSTYGMGINIVSFFIALLGTSYIIKRFGVRISLLIYPVIFACVLLGFYTYFKMGLSPAALLWSAFAAMIVIKGVGYAVNNPTKEMMYIPTSKDAKFKSKGWIDTFGSRFAKAGGARVTDAYKTNLADLMTYGTFIGFGLIGFWIMAALAVGYKNKQLVDNKQIIE